MNARARAYAKRWRQHAAMMLWIGKHVVDDDERFFWCEVYASMYGAAVDHFGADE